MSSSPFFWRKQKNRATGASIFGTFSFSLFFDEWLSYRAPFGLPHISGWNREAAVVNGGILRQCSGVHKYEENDRLHMGIKKANKTRKKQKRNGKKTYIHVRESSNSLRQIIEDAASRFPFRVIVGKTLIFPCIIAPALMNEHLSLSSSSSSPFFSNSPPPLSF